MNRTEKVHLLFRGAAEVTKWLRNGSLFCELAAAAVALYIILLKPPDTAAWLPLGVLGVTALGTALHSYSSSANGFAQRCRRISLRAYCAGKDVDAVTVATLDDDTPFFVETATTWLPAKTIDQYYEPTAPVGDMRMAELYAHSMFYTWRNLRIQSIMTFILALIVAIVCGAIIYHLAAKPTLQADRQAMLEAICTVVLLVIALKGFRASWEAHSSASEVRSIENVLLKKPKGDALLDLVDSYDIERAAGASPMTIIYCITRRTLSAKWNERKKIFV